MIEIIILIATLTGINVETKPNVPKWFTEDLKKNVGFWEADNSQYKSDKEPQEKYILQWQWGVGNTSITGHLYGMINGKTTTDYWQFRQYWDNVNNKPMLVQYGGGGSIGLGELIMLKDGSIENIQEFSVPTGQKWYTKHIVSNDGKVSDTTSYDKNKQGKWIKNRHYIWHKIKATQVEINELGKFSISLSVKNIKTSYVFYQKLGFNKLDGNIEQNWIILINGTSKIGLFQGMFPKNTITFNPKDVRKIHLKLNKLDVKPVFTNGLDKESGAASFSIIDPDGNPILIDQH